MSEQLTDAERKQIAEQLSSGVCRCGHLRSEHSKFIGGLFVGCQHSGCGCTHFLWPQKGMEELGEPKFVMLKYEERATRYVELGKNFKVFYDSDGHPDRAYLSNKKVAMPQFVPAWPGDDKMISQEPPIIVKMTEEELGMYFVMCPSCGEKYWAEDPHDCPARHVNSQED